MTTTKQMIVNAFTKAFNKHFYNELVIGKLAHSEMKDHINKGDEVDVTMPGLVTLFDYDGGDLPTAEAATVSTCKVKIDRGKAFHFELSEMEEQMMQRSSDNPESQVELAKDYTNDAIKQFAAAEMLLTLIFIQEPDIIWIIAERQSPLVQKMQKIFSHTCRLNSSVVMVKVIQTGLTARWYALFRRNISSTWVKWMNLNILKQVKMK